MSVSTFLQDVENLDHSARTKRMVELGRRSRHDAASQQLVEALRSGSTYEQFLALETCYGSRQLSFAIHTLSASSSTLLRRRALNLVIRCGADSQVSEALDSVPIYLQIHAVKRLRRFRRRLPVIDAFLQKHNKTDMFLTLLPYGSGELVESYLPEIFERLSSENVRRAATFHPKIVHTFLRKWAEASDKKQPRLIKIVTDFSLLWEKSITTIDLYLDLLQLMLKFTDVSSWSWDAVIRKRPWETVEILLATTSRYTPRTFNNTLRSLNCLTVDKTLALLRRYPNLIQSAFRFLRLDQRLAAYPLLRDHLRLNGGSVPSQIIGTLPETQRVIEARQQLESAEPGKGPSYHISYIALLPWDEAMALQRTYLGSNAAAIRELALKHQISAVKYDKVRLQDALALALRCKNEQNHVRQELFVCLSRIPRNWWNAAHLEILAQVIRHALDSQLSVHGQDIVLRFAMSMIPFHPRWAARQMIIIMKEFTEVQPQQIRFPGSLPDHEIFKVLSEELSPWLRTFVKDESCDISSLSSMAVALCDRVKYWPDLLDTLEQLFRNGDKRAEGCLNGGIILRILKQARPRSFPALASILIGRGSRLARSTILIEHVHRTQQRLLDVVLEKDIPQILFDVEKGFEKWSSRQQDRLLSMLKERIDREDVSREDKRLHIRQLARLAFVDPNAIMNLSRDERPIIRELSIRNLSAVDGDAGLAELMRALHDERSRFAIYSVRPVFKGLSSEEVSRILMPVSMKQVTVAKEVIHIFGSMETNTSLHHLIRLEKTDLHPDAYIALLHELQRHVENDEVWKIFVRAAKNPMVKIAEEIISFSNLGLLRSKDKKSLLQLALVLQGHISAKVRYASLLQLSRNPIEDPECLLLRSISKFLESSDKYTISTAMRVLMNTYARSQPHLIEDLFRSVLQNRSRLHLAVQAYLDFCNDWPADHTKSATLLIVEVLKTNRLTFSMQYKLMHRLPFEDYSSYLLATIPHLHGDALVECERFIRTNASNYTEQKTKSFELILAAEKDERARRLALEFLLAGVNSQIGYSEEQKERLFRYREDESVMVAEAAWDTILPEEAKL